jgi:hypothetical protein
MIIPKNMDREDFAERKRVGAKFLGQIARASAGQRKGRLIAWAETLYDTHAEQRIRLLESLDDIHVLVVNLALFYSGTIIPLLAVASPDSLESEAISLAIAGRESQLLASSVLLFPAAVTKQNSAGAAIGSRVASQDPIAAKRRAHVDAYLREVLRVTKKRISRTDFWQKAGYKEATAFERWQRNDPRSSKNDDRAFMRVLNDKPHLK